MTYLKPLRGSVKRWSLERVPVLKLPRTAVGLIGVGLALSLGVAFARSRGTAQPHREPIVAATDVAPAMGFRPGAPNSCSRWGVVCSTVHYHEGFGRTSPRFGRPKCKREEIRASAHRVMRPSQRVSSPC